MVQSVLDEVKSGKVNLYVAPTQPFGGGEENGEDAISTTEVGLVKVDRDDVAEAWLVRCLLALASDLKASEEPILFMTYGRGRAMFSSLGKGIHPDNLVQDVQFITGACSCTVKEQNPGVDLIVQYDWEAAATALAQKFGAEEGSRYHFGGDTLFPELIIPAGSEMGQASEESSGETVEVETQEPAAEVPGTVIAPAGQMPQNPGAADPPAGDGGDVTAVVSGEADGTTHVASSQPLPQDQPAGQPGSAIRGVLFVGIGLAATFVVLFAATFLVLRPK